MATDSYSIHVSVDSTDAVSATRNLRGMEQATGGAEAALKGLARAAVGLVALDKLAALGKDILDVNRSMEMLRAQLLSVTGSAVGAQKAFQFINDFAKNTPFEIDGLTKSFLLLKNMGINPTTQVMSALTNQASKLGASQETLTSITMQLGQAYSKGKLQQEDMVVLAERGVPIYKLLADVTGKNTSQLADMSAKGLITRDVIDKLIIKMGEMAAGSNAVAMDTLNGKISGLSDAWHTFEDALLNDKSEGFIKSIVTSITETLNMLTRNMGNTLDDQIAHAEARVKTFKGLGVVGSVVGDFAGYDVNVELNKIDALKKQKEKLAVTEKEIPVAKEIVTITKSQTDLNKEAAKVKKDLAEAEANFKAQQDATIASSEIAGKILSGQSATQLLALTAERKAIEDKAKVSMASATEQATKNAITQQTQDALFASLDKTRAIEAAIIAQSAATIDVKIAAAQAELDTAGKYNLTLAEQLRLKSELAGLQAEKGLIPEQMAQLDIRTQGGKDEIVSNAAAERIKAISEAQTAANERATAEILILTANLDAAREAAAGLADAFGAVGGSIGDIGIAFASYEKSQAAITDGLEQQLFSIEKMNDGKGDQAKKDKAISDASSKQDKLQVKSYGDMTKAAQGFFEKGSTGYKALGVATKVFRAFEMAQSAMSMVKMITDNAAKVGAYITGIFTSTAANTASVLPNAAADGAKATASGTAAVAAASAAPFPIGFATGAAMLAFMLAIGVAMAGSGSSSSAPTMSGADYQKQQEDAYSASLGGTVLGSNDSSNSILDALDIISENSTADLDYSRGMANNLESIASSLGVANAEISKRFNFSTSSAGLGTSGSSNIFSSSKTSRDFAGSGIQFVSQTLGEIINEGVLKAKQYTDILVTKTSSSFFGLFSSTSQSVQTIFSELDKSISSAIARTLIDTKQSIISASELAGAGSESIKLKLSDFLVDLGKMPLSTDATKNNEVLTAAMSKAADQMALLNPMFIDFQKTGEGYYQTLMRVTVLISTAQSKLKTLGIEAINYSDILVKSGDVEKQMIIQSIIASSKMEDLNAIMGMLPGTADDAIAAFKDLVAIKQGLKDVGAASVLLDGNLIVTAGGISALKDSLASYFDNYFTDQEKLISKSETLSNSFAKLGLLMPIVNATFDSTTGVVTDAKANYKTLLDVLKNDTTARGREIYVLALAMSQDFADAADLNAQLVKEKLTEQNKIIDASYNRQIAIYKALGDTEAGLGLEREKAMLSMDKETKAYTVTLNKLTDANVALEGTQKTLETAYKGLTAMRDKFVTLGKGLLTYYNELTGAKNPTASPEQIYNSSKKAFTDASILAAQGNEVALASLPALGKEFLDSSKQYNATGEAYQADYKAVLKSLEDSMVAVKTQEDLMQLQLDQAKAANDKLSALDASVNTVTSSILILSDALASFVTAQEIKAASEKLARLQATTAATTAEVATGTISALTSTGDTGAAIDAANNLASTNASNEAARIAAEQTAAEASKTKAAQERAALLAGYRSSVPTTIAPGGTSNPYWESVIGQFSAEHKARFGVSMNRGWGTDADAARQYEALKQQYLASIPAYAMGGIANGLSLVGEQGAELVNFGSPANVTNHSKTVGLFDNISQSIKDSSEIQTTLLKEQVIELQALVNLQSSANVAMINELKGMKAEISELTRKAKLEASS